MLLHDIGKSPDSTFRKINQHLETNYGFKISEDASDKDLVNIMEQIEEEITDLKVKGGDAKASSEISKRLLVLEGLKSLREYVVVQFQSKELEPLVANLIDAIVDHFNEGGLHMGHFDSAVDHTMREYRKSNYDFPNEYIEDRIRRGAESKLRDCGTEDSDGDMSVVGNGMMESEDLGENSVYTKMGKRASADGGHAAELPDTEAGYRAGKVAERSRLSIMPQDQEGSDPQEQVPMIRDKNGRMVPDPFAAQAAARRKGIAMNEHTNLVKNLRYLLETEVSQAEVMMAAKGFAQELQEMVEKIGRLQNEDLPPVTDQMRETYGMNSASAFQTQIYGALQSVMDALYTAKQQVDDAVGNMASKGQVTAQTDMDVPMDGMEDDMDSRMDGEDDLDNIGDEMDSEDSLGDEFGGEESLGRSKKMESALQRKVMEMQRLVAKARELKEAKN